MSRVHLFSGVLREFREAGMFYRVSPHRSLHGRLLACSRTIKNSSPRLCHDTSYAAICDSQWDSHETVLERKPGSGQRGDTTSLLLKSSSFKQACTWSLFLSVYSLSLMCNIALKIILENLSLWHMFCESWQRISSSHVYIGCMMSSLCSRGFMVTINALPWGVTHIIDLRNMTFFTNKWVKTLVYWCSALLDRCLKP